MFMHLGPRVGGLNWCWLIRGRRGAKGGVHEGWQVVVLEMDMELAGRVVSVGTW